MQITQARNAKTLTPSHMKQCILSESRFDFLKDLVKNVPDASIQEDNEYNALFEESPIREVPVVVPKNPRGRPREKHQPHTEVSPSPSNEQSTSSRAPVIHYGPKVVKAENTKLNFSAKELLKEEPELHKAMKEEPELHITIASEQLPVPQLLSASISSSLPSRVVSSDNVPPLIPISNYNQNTNDSLCIDEDYDN
ncbi:unnamed protein product [Phaedon cochleariae]|uniref:Dr1-associated corepressor n=1 Tax=Phaedon cochleariae TaxID=80249 RepID=A0A9N9SLU1_PHACE|nr:unnamed protein product [Phaedon cochleariae]